MRRSIWLAVTLLVTLSFSHARVQSQQEPVPEPNQDELANWIMEKVVEKSLENERVKRQYITYDKYQTTEDLTEQSPKEKKETYNIYGKNGQSIECLVEVNGKPTRKKCKPSTLDFSSTLADKYLPRMNFSKVGEEVIDGKGYFIISFEPKSSPDRLPSDDIYDRGINRSSGIMYIDMEKFYPWKFESRIIEDFSAYVLVRAEDFQMYVEQEEKFGVIVPEKVIYTVKYKFLWITTHERKTSTYGNHQDLRSPAAPEK